MKDVKSAGGKQRVEHEKVSEVAAILAGAAQRTRLLVNGVAGNLTDRQRALSMDILKDIEALTDLVENEFIVPKPVLSEFDAGQVCADLIGEMRFAAHARQLAITLLGSNANNRFVYADLEAFKKLFRDGVRGAVSGANSGTRVSVELVRSADRIAIDVSAPGWNPQLPIAVKDSNISISVLRMASGSRLVLSMYAKT